MDRGLKIFLIGLVIFLIGLALFIYSGSISFFEGLGFWNSALILILVIFVFLVVRPVIDELISKIK